MKDEMTREFEVFIAKFKNQTRVQRVAAWVYGRLRGKQAV